jgi:hypothetical protein
LKEQNGSGSLDENQLRLDCEPAGVKIGLHILKEDLDPQYISNLIGLKPTVSFKRGDVSGLSKAPKLNGVWSLSVAASENSNDISVIVDNFTKTVRYGNIENLQLLKGNDYEISLILRLGIKHWNTSCVLDEKSLHQLASIGIPFKIDIYDEQ